MTAHLLQFIWATVTLIEDKYPLKTDILAATQTRLQNEPPTETDWVVNVSTIQGIELFYYIYRVIIS